MKTKPIRTGFLLLAFHSLAVVFLLLPSLIFDSDATRFLFEVFRVVDYPVNPIVTFLLRLFDPLWFWITEMVPIRIGALMICADVVLFLVIGGAFYFVVGFALAVLSSAKPKSGPI